MSGLVETKWTTETVPDLVGGLVAPKRPDQLEANESPNIENLVFEQQFVALPTGYQAFAGLTRGVPRVTYQFERTTGTIELVLVTDATFYVYNGTQDQWQYVSDGIDTTTDGTASAGATVIPVTDTTGFAATQFVGIILDNGDQHQTTIASISAGVSITVDDAIPVGRSVNIGAAVVKAADLNGDADNPVDILTVPGQDWAVFTNGVDNVKRYDGLTIEDVPNLPSGGNTQCRAIELLQNTLILFGTIEGGTAFRHRVRWPVIGDSTDWSGVTSGFEDLFDTAERIEAARKLNREIVIYKTTSISKMRYTGVRNQEFNIAQNVVQNIGTFSPKGVINVSGTHFFAAEDNFYSYDGGAEPQPVGDKVQRILFGTDSEINPTFRARSILTYIESRREIYFFYPDGSNSDLSKVMILDLKEGSFTRRDLFHDLGGIGEFQSQIGRTWNDLIGSWAQQTWNWNSPALAANAPTLQLMGVSPLQVYNYDFATGGDGGNSITWVVETKDFELPGYEIRIDDVAVLLRGTGVILEYSEDLGNSWMTYATINNATTLTTRVHKQIVVPKVRWRFRGTDGNFRLGWLTFRFTPETYI